MSDKVHDYLRKIELRHDVTITDTVPALFCSCDTDVPPDIIGCGKYPSWCLILRCRLKDCLKKKKWNVCVKCINVIGLRKKMYGNPELRRHNELHEAFQRADATVTGVNVASLVTNNDESITPAGQLLTLDSVHSSLVDNLEYYVALQKGKAMNYLVGKQFHEQNMNQEVISDIDAQLHTLIAYVSLSQTKRENAMFAQLIKLIDKQHKLKVQQLIDDRNIYRYVFTPLTFCQSCTQRLTSSDW